METDHAHQADPPAPLAASLLLTFVFFWLPAGIAATVWWFT